MLRDVSAAALVVLALLVGANGAHASIVFDRRGEIWISADDGSGARRLADGASPRIAPGGATVLYRSAGGSRVYAVPAAGGPRRHLLTLPRRQRFPSYVSLVTDFATGGGHAIVGSIAGKAHLADLDTGAIRRLPVTADRARVSPDGARVALLDRRRPCELEVLDLASGRIRVLNRHVCAVSFEWGPGGIAFTFLDVPPGLRWRSDVQAIDPETGARTPLLDVPRLLRFEEPARSGAWRLEATEDGRRAAAVWVVQPDGTRMARRLPRGSHSPVRFGLDGRSAVFPRATGSLVRLDLVTGARRRVGEHSGGFDVG